MSCENPATGANTAMYFCEEDVCNITNANPVWKRWRFNDSIPALNRDTLQSAELTGQPEIAAVRGGNFTAGGTINSELSYGSFDDLLEACYQGTWAVDNPVAGTDSLKIGTTRRSFSVMTVFNDLTAGSDKYHITTGVEITAHALTFGVNAMATIALTIIGRDYVTQAALQAGATFAPEPTTRPYTGIDVSKVEIDSGSGPEAVGFITAINPSLDWGANAEFALGSRSVAYIGYTLANSTFSMDYAFQNDTFFKKFVSETEFAATVELDFDGNKLQLYYPRCNLTTAPINVGGPGTITISGEVQAIRDTTEGFAVRLARTAV